MDFLDQEGRLFGLVNIIDLVIILLILSVAGIGTVFVLQPDEGKETTKTQMKTEHNKSIAIRYATVNLGIRYEFIAGQISEGDTDTIKNSNFTVMDVHYTPAKKGVHVWARVRLQGKKLNHSNHNQFVFNGKKIDVGDKIPIKTPEYGFKGVIHDMDENNPNLPEKTTKVVIQTTVSTETIDNIQINDSYRVSGRSIATIESIDVNPTKIPSKKRVSIGLSLNTLNTSGQEKFVGRPVQIGQKLPFRTDLYDITGTIVHRGNTTLPGKRGKMIATIKLSNVKTEIAENIKAGMVERIDGNVNARIADKQIEPATVILKSQDGDIYKREHPTKKDIYLTVELNTRRTDRGLYFHNVQLQEGNSLTLNLGSITIRGQVINLRNGE